MGRYLIVTWDGAGNLAPTLGIARTLVERGHDVRMIGHATIVERCGDVGARFVPLSQGRLWDAMEDPDDFEAEVKLLVEQLCFSSTIARDVALELEREPADAVLVDCMLFTAIDVALASGTPTATLFHTPYTIFRADRWSRCSRRACRSRTRSAPRSACPPSNDSATSMTPARARWSRCRRSSSPTCRTRPTSCASVPCSTHLRCPARSTASTSATGRRRWCSSASARATRARPTCCSGASMRSRSCRCAPS